MLELAKALRVFAAFVLIAGAALFLLVAATMPWLLKDDAAENRRYLTYFERTGGYVERFQRDTGRLPNEAELEAWAAHQGFGWWADSLSITPIGCEQDGFQPASGDRIVLAVWRGEFFDCYALPSGKNTLQTSTAAFLTSGFAATLAIYAAIAAALGWLAWRIWPLKRAAHPS